jgi:hypothetical protein
LGETATVVRAPLLTWNLNRGAPLSASHTWGGRVQEQGVARSEMMVPWSHQQLAHVTQSLIECRQSAVRFAGKP